MGDGGVTRIPYDQTAKKLLDGALQGAGRATVQHELSNEPQWIDVWFERKDTKPLPPGLFGTMIASSCAFEIFTMGAKKVLKDPDEKAIVMNATSLYEQIKEAGREEGRKALLLRMLGRRFGELPRAVVVRVEAADSAQLDRWGERLVKATTLNDVFGRKR